MKKSKLKPYLLTHTGLLKLVFIHNHPITSAHALSFRDVLEETKHALYSLFEIGHSPSSARHAREQALYIQAESEAEAQLRLADRAHNPLIQDICRLFIKWREATYGKDNGEGVFAKLQEKVDRYNSDASAAGGKVILQWYQTPATEYSEHESESETESNPPPTKRKRREVCDKPLILAICTPLMARAHWQVLQAGEIVFCDATSSLDRYNKALFILSTTHACSGVPLAAVMVSDESEQTVTKAMETVKQVLPADAFYGNGPLVGPSVFMIDDSTVEHAALSKSWPSASILLCTFHFLQRRWTWLYEGKNRLQKEDCITLIQLVRSLVYSQTEEELKNKSMLPLLLQKQPKTIPPL